MAKYENYRKLIFFQNDCFLSKILTRSLQSMPFEVRCVLPVRDVDGEDLVVYQPSEISRDGAAWFEEFRARTLLAIGQRWLPVYRMADGEFIYSVGWKPDRAIGLKPILKRVLWRLRLYEPSLKPTCWGEQYSSSEKMVLQEKYVSDLREIATNGSLAVFLGRYREIQYPHYNPHMLEWFANNRISLAGDNSVPFHFVLAALTGDGAMEYYEHRTILVVSSLKHDNREKVRATLMRLGAKRVLFGHVSANKAMLDKVDLSEVDTEIDLALVAAGVGSANVLCALRPLRTLCLDVGSYIHALENPTVKPHGIFAVPGTGIRF